MKLTRTLVILSALLLCGGLSWADGPSASGDADHCWMPDLAGLSPEQAEVALMAAGLVAPAAQAAATYPACPVDFECSSIPNCAAGAPCGLTDLGPCCTAAGGVRCCTSGTIAVLTCPCQCTGFLCSLQCAASSNVNSRCVP